ncbi:MAG: hypothetical protein KIT54_05025 [Phycisphaeraceae bacterium]|nr:hypothetical protein [Phycisphaeraceae bacterium]
MNHILALASFLLTTVAVPAIAQQDAASVRRGQPIAQTASPDPQTHPISINFKGGTLAELVAALKAASPDRPVNIIYSAEAGQIPIPPFEVTDADLYSTLQSLSYTSSGSPVTLDFGRLVSWQISRVDYGVFSIQLSSNPRPVFDSRGRQVQAGGPVNRYTTIQTIAELTIGGTAMSADDVLSALQAALAMQGGEEVKLAYHEATGLVFASVTGEQGQVIENTIMMLRQSYREWRDHARQQQQNTDTGKQIKELSEQVTRLVEENKELRKQIAFMQSVVIPKTPDQPEPER